MRTIPGGAFMMGSPPDEHLRRPDETLHPVQVGNFEIGIFEVTRSELAHPSGDYTPTWTHWLDQLVNRAPAAATWNTAAAYANAVSWSRGLEECYACENGHCVPQKAPRDCLGYRLPTEAEWEYAARELGKEKRPWLRAYTLRQQAQVDYSTVIGNPTGMWPAGSRRPNELGLFDMLGNGVEWVHDGYGPYPQPTGNVAPGLVANPSGVGASSTRILRGGRVWIESPQFPGGGPSNLRFGARATALQSDSSMFNVFRLARTLP
ncbi:MAG: SUMF1/EgtB/PvdO family nonheme iron enzyme [Myxococcales bacterium]|nr:SUMF1/EgtB/PvdO family nonheme iron enzyme [Myxococcales bacterium]